MQHAYAALRNHPYRVAFVIIMAGMSIPFLLMKNNEWDDVYRRAGADLGAGRFQYGTTGYVYPPFAAALAVPFAWLPRPVSKFLWLTINLACLAGMLRLAWALSGGKKPEGRPPAPWAEHLICCLGLLCAGRFALNAFSHHQTDLLIGFALLGGIALLVEGNSLAGAALIGLASAFKGPPLLFAPFFASRGQWRAAFLIILTAVGLNGIPDLIAQNPAGEPWLITWARNYVLPLASAQHQPGSWYSEMVLNQSLGGAARRWLATTWEWNASGFTVADVQPALSSRGLKLLVYGSELCLVGLTLVCARRGTGPTGDSSMPRWVWESSAVLTLMLLVSPMSSKAHFGVLLLPAWLLARSAIQQRDWIAGGLLVAAILTQAPSLHWFGASLSQIALWYGSVTLCTLLLWAGCCRTLLWGTDAAHSTWSLPLQAVPPALTQAA